jgi:hypothetical protein
MWILLLSFGCSTQRPKTTPVPPPNPDVTYPKVMKATSKTAASLFKHSFTFEGHHVEVSVRLDGAALEGARATKKSIEMMTVIPQPEQDAGLYWALISDPAQDSFFEDLIARLRQIKTTMGLDTDRYAELITVFVQSIEYCSSADMPPKYPIETAADTCGDCDDKSLLAAALLFRENYDVALFTFHEDNHTALGIRSTDEGYLNSGYAYIETTSPSYIGFPYDEYSTVKITSTPIIITLGKKPNIWTKSDEVNFLHNTLKQERAHAESISKSLTELQATNKALKADYEQQLSDLKQAKGRVTVGEYNKLVDQTNRMGDKLNRAVDKHNALAKECNRSNDIAKYIFDHPDDRYGVYRWVKAQ